MKLKGYKIDQIPTGGGWGTNQDSEPWWRGEGGGVNDKDLYQDERKNLNRTMYSK
jgi:hypothetical protein